MRAVTAIVLAGSRPGRDPFAEAFGTDLKALIPVGGKPMVCRPVEALLASDRIDRIRVLTQQPERLHGALTDDERITIEQSGDTISATLEAFCFDENTEWPLLVTTADHALLTPIIVDEFLDKAEGADVAFGLVEQDNLLRRLPDVQRTWLKFRGGAYSGANLFLIGGPQVRGALELWRTVEQDRKRAWRLVWAFGPSEVLCWALRLTSLQGMLRRIGRRIGLSIRAVELSDPLAAVDVDKPADHELVTAILTGRA